MSAPHTSYQWALSLLPLSWFLFILVFCLEHLLPIVLGLFSWIHDKHSSHCLHLPFWNRVLILLSFTLKPLYNSLVPTWLSKSCCLTAKAFHRSMSHYLFFLVTGSLPATWKILTFPLIVKAAPLTILPYCTCYCPSTQTWTFSLLLFVKVLLTFPNPEHILVLFLQLS